MPQAVGMLPAGTLLFSASIGLDAVGALMEQRIYRSDDAGATFTRIEGAACGRPAFPTGVRTTARRCCPQPMGTASC
jgi:hypothetical protein